MKRKVQNQSRSQQDKGWNCPGPSCTAPLPPSSFRVVIAHRHEAFRLGLCALLAGERDLQVVGQANSIGQMLSEVRRTRAQAVFMESGLSNGLEPHAYRSLAHILPSIRIISLTKDMHAEAFRNAVKAGVQGYLPENAGRIELIRAIRTVAKGGLYFVLSSS